MRKSLLVITFSLASTLNLFSSAATAQTDPPPPPDYLEVLRLLREETKEQYESLTPCEKQVADNYLFSVAFWVSLGDLGMFEWVLPSLLSDASEAQKACDSR